jgi:hypothetical protein
MTAQVSLIAYESQTVKELDYTVTITANDVVYTMSGTLVLKSGFQLLTGLVVPQTDVSVVCTLVDKYGSWVNVSDSNIVFTVSNNDIVVLMKSTANDTIIAMPDSTFVISLSYEEMVTLGQSTVLSFPFVLMVDGIVLTGILSMQKANVCPQLRVRNLTGIEDESASLVGVTQEKAPLAGLTQDNITSLTGVEEK